MALSSTERSRRWREAGRDQWYAKNLAKARAQRAKAARKARGWFDDPSWAEPLEPLKGVQ